MSMINKDSPMVCFILDVDGVMTTGHFLYTVKYGHASLLGVQIFRAKHLYEMMVTAGNNRVIRTECLGQHINYNAESIVITPKIECCRHYDAYMHTAIVVRDFITSSRVPPLFIPDNFFDKKMKIRYGFDEYLEDFININPAKNSYIFDSKSGTDLAIAIEDLPAFWRGRIESLEINPNFKGGDSKNAYLSMEINNPWRNKSWMAIKLSVVYRKFHFKILLPIFGNAYLKCRGKLSFLKRIFRSAIGA